MIAAGVVFIRGNNTTFGAGINAKVAFLAKFFIYFNVAFQDQSPKQF
jgi:hypothetical protein